MLARVENAPPGTKGLSLFIVPKRKINADGSAGESNDVQVAGIEHKMGINGSATAQLNFGENGTCVGELVGSVENMGMSQMFKMMNGARIAVGVQGLAVASSAYLNALSGSGDEAGKDLLLGGVTMNAQLFNLDNWKLKALEVKHENADLAHAVGMMNDLDQAGRRALTKLMGAERVGDDLQVTQVSKEDAEKLLKPTTEKALAFQKAHPVLAYVTRVGHEVYWHPKNPMRPLLTRAAGQPGKYSLDMYRWTVFTSEGPAKTPREWPLRVLRFKVGKVDTGWKILPASDWNAE